MANGYLPNRDTEFLEWAQNFSTYLTAHAAELGVSVADAEAVELGVSTFDVNMTGHETAAATARSQRVQKDTSRESITGTIRSLVRQIQARPATTDIQREALGITLSEPGPTPDYSPIQSSPLGTIDAHKRLRHELRYVDQATPTSRAKPVYAEGAEIFCAIRELTDPTPLGPEGYVNLGQNKNSPFIVEHPASQVGKMAHYILRWVAKDGTKGPWSEIVSATILG